METLELDPSTTEGWACEEAVDAERSRRKSAADALDAEIRALVRSCRVSHAQVCARLARMRREALWEPLNYGTFAAYAVDVGAASSYRAARQKADLSEQLEPLPLLRGVFERGEADWTKVREAAPVATPETDAKWAGIVVNSTYDEVRAMAQEARGKPPTRRITFDLPREVVARFRQFVSSTGERLGERLTNEEAFELMLETAARCEPCPREQAQETQAPTEPVIEPGQVPDASARADRVPPPSATLVGYVCERCHEVSVPAADGLVPVSPARAGLLECDAVVQEADGTRTRKIPPRIRSMVYVRDRGACRVPRCGARGFLHEHHEGKRGWRETGHDPDRVCLLCHGHHRQRHMGMLEIQPLGGGQFRFRFMDGWEQVSTPGATLSATVAHVGSTPPEQEHPA